MRQNKLLWIILLHILLAVYSFGGIFSKLAARVPFLSFSFCFCYSGVIALLAIYAIGWQQIIKRLPLTTAFANKAVTVVWGIVWGVLFFHERITVGKLIGALIVIAGVVLYVTSDKEDSDGE